MKLLATIPKGLTHGEELVVIRKSDYEALQRRVEEYKDTLGKIKRGEVELRAGKTRIINSLAEIS